MNHYEVKLATLGGIEYYRVLKNGKEVSMFMSERHAVNDLNRRQMNDSKITTTTNTDTNKYKTINYYTLRDSRG